MYHESQLPYERVKAENGEVLDKMIFMPVVQLHKKVRKLPSTGYLEHMKPQAFELVFNNDSPEVQRTDKKST